MLGVTLTAGMVNWYDVVVVGTMFYGVWSGIRNGLMGELIRVIGLILMFVLAAALHQSVGNWLSANSPLPDDAAQLVAFISIAVVVYLVIAWVRVATRKRLLEVKTSPIVENVGGGFAGAVRMVLVMAWVTVVLSVSVNSSWRDEVGINSRFGSLVLNQFPATRIAMEHNPPEKTWIPTDEKRRVEPNYDVSGPTNTQPAETNSK